MAEWLDRRHLRKAVAAIAGCALVFAQIPSTHAAAQAGNAELKREYNRMVSEAATFKAFMTQVEQATTIDFGDEKAATAVFERLKRFSPDDISKGFVSTLVLAAARNPQFQAGVRQRLAEGDPDEFLKALQADPALARQIPGAAAADSDVKRSIDDAKGKVASLKKKAEGRAGRGAGAVQNDAIADPAPPPGGGPWAPEEAQTEIFVAMTIILGLAVFVMIVIGLTAVALKTTYDLYRIVQLLARAHTGYRSCYDAASRQIGFWAQEIYKLGCFAAFLG